MIVENIKIFVEIVKKESSHLKSVFGYWVDRVSIPEIRVEWREVVENFFMVMLSLFLYASVIFTQFAFVPIMIVTIKRGWKEAVIYLTLASILLLYVMVNAAYRIPYDSGLLLFSPTHFTFEFIGNILGVKGSRFLDYYFIFGILGIFIGHLVSKNYKLKYVIFFSLTIYVGIVVFILSISGIFGGFESFISDYSQFVERKTSSYVNLYLSQMDNYRNILRFRGIDSSFLERKVEIAVDVIKRSVLFGAAPKGGYLIKQIIFIFLGILFVKLYFRGRLNRAALKYDIRNYRIANDWVWGLIVSWGLVYVNLYLGNSFLEIVSWNSAVIFSFLFFLKGLKLIKIAADRIKIPKLIQYLVLLFFLFYFFIFFITIVTGIGVADIWLKISDITSQLGKRRDS